MIKDEGIYIRCTHTKEDDMLVYQSTNKDVGFIVTSTELDENVAIMTDHTGVRKLRDYLNEILGEEQDTQPAGGEPVALTADDLETFKLETVFDSQRGSMTTDTWNRAITKVQCHLREMGAKLVAAPPAAAHGDEAVLWELLEGLRTATDRQALPGEFIRVMWEAGCDWINARAAMRAQAGEGGE